MLLSIQHCAEQKCFQFFLEDRQADVTDPHFRRQCVPASGTGHRKCPRTNCLCATRWHNQFTRCCRSKVWPGGNAGNRNSTWPGIEEPIHSDIWRPWCRVYSQSLLVHRASEVDYSCRQLSDCTSTFAGWAEQMLAWPGRADPKAHLTHHRAVRCNNRSWTESKPGPERGTNQPRGIV